MNNGGPPPGQEGQQTPRGWRARIRELDPKWIGAIATLLAAAFGGGGFLVGHAVAQTVSQKTVIQTVPQAVAQTVSQTVTQTVSQTVTQTITASPSVDKAAYIGHIVEWFNGPGQPDTSWLVESDGERYWIPNQSTFYCLLNNKGHTDLGPQSSTVLDDLPDSGHWASC